MLRFNISGQIFPKAEKNKFYKAIDGLKLPNTDFFLDDEKDILLVQHKPSSLTFAVMPTRNVGELVVQCAPNVFLPVIVKGINFYQDNITKWSTAHSIFAKWAKWLEAEYNTPNLWDEVIEAAQFFAPITPTDDMFTRAELAEVQGQLRRLERSFTASALPEATQQKLIELAQTAAVKAQSFTKRDWQGWFIGSLISSITALALNPKQADDVYKLAKAVFSGLFLQ